MDGIITTKKLITSQSSCNASTLSCYTAANRVAAAFFLNSSDKSGPVQLVVVHQFGNEPSTGSSSSHRQHEFLSVT